MYTSNILSFGETVGRIQQWWRRRLLRRHEFSDKVWRRAWTRLPWLHQLEVDDQKRLRDLVTLFLAQKTVQPIGDVHLDEIDRVVIALQACILILNLGLDQFKGWSTIVVYPTEFTSDIEEIDDIGVVHEMTETRIGETSAYGPIYLAWDEARALEKGDAYHNLLIHEFAHKLDLANGEANGLPPLPDSMSVAAWAAAFSQAFADFRRRVEHGEATVIDPYAAQDAGEFFAVLSEVFFVAPAVLKREYPEVYAQLCFYYDQDPDARAGNPAKPLQAF